MEKIEIEIKNKAVDLNKLVEEMSALIEEYRVQHNPFALVLLRDLEKISIHSKRLLNEMPKDW